ncbi:29041_t:CDS:10, partial [Racocetra persica]
FSQREQAEKNLKKLLEEIASENDELSSKAQVMLRDFDIIIKNLAAERYWNSTKVNEEREKTRLEEIISNEKEKQHFFKLKSNIAMEHDIASNLFQIQIQNRFKRYNDSSKQNDSKKRIKIDDYFPVRSITPQTNISTVDLNPDDSCVSFVSHDISCESYEQSICADEDDKFKSMISWKSHDNILDMQMDFEEKDELTEDEFEKRLADTDIVDISSSNPSSVNKVVFNKLKKTAQSQPPPRINVDGLRKWIQKNYARELTITMSNLRSTTTIENFNTEQTDFIKRNTYTATIVSPDFELLKFSFPNLFISRWNDNEVPSSKWCNEIVYGDENAFARNADGILFNYENTSQEFLLFENVSSPLKTKNPKYKGDLLKCFQNSVDAICKTFWNGDGDVELAKKYYVLAYV